jgi:glyoxylase-like metal-dependent hydrolase (beta-lactamase superfamily II)
MKTDLAVFFDPVTFTLTYLVWSPCTMAAVIIDPVLDFDPVTRRTSRASVEKLLKFVRAKNLRVEWILETHAHTDHLSSAGELQNALPGSQRAMGHKMAEVFATFKGVFAWPEDLKLDGLGVSRWLRDGEEIGLQGLTVQALETPGHTPACLTFRIGEWLFTGDALMMPDIGVGRCDFPGGSAIQLYNSIWGKLYALPDGFQVFPGHDYPPASRGVRYQARLSAHKEGNTHLRTCTSRDQFVTFREARDKTLTAPRLLQPSLDWNLGAHQLVKRSEAPPHRLFSCQLKVEELSF